MDNYLHIYPTSRALRGIKEEYVSSNSLIPKLITISEFEQKSVLLGDLSLVDSTLRAIYLREAANFDEFKSLNSDLALLKFYSQADDFFRFFEEVNAEGVSIDELYYADSYAEFDRDLKILKMLLNNYKEILLENGLTDRVFNYENIKLNRAFLESFDGFILNLEGYLTKYELKLFNEISKIKPFIIKLKVSPYNKKVIESFKELGINLPKESSVEFDLGKKEVLKVENYPLSLNCEVIEVSQRFEQIAVAFAKIEEFVKNGIEPKNIALILPDEELASVVESYDLKNNLNFAMGHSYCLKSSYTILEELYQALKGEKLSKEYLNLAGLNIDLNSLNKEHCVEDFFATLKEHKLPLYSSEEFEKELKKLNLAEEFFRFKKIFKDRVYSFQIWLYLWLDRLKEHTLDDVSGGKVTVMGLLESRGLEFDGVVILDFNEGYVPSISNKDRFLNSAVRANAKLPTKEDRENLQKYYYTQVLQKAKKSCLVYQKSSTIMPSKFLYELGLDRDIVRYKTPLGILYSQKSQYNSKSYLKDEEVAFDATKFVWSATSLKSFLECKRKFYYRYILKLQEPKSDELNEGRVLHNVLADVLTPNCNFNSIDELKKSFLIKLSKIEGDIELLYKKPLWAKLLEPFFKKQIEHLNSGWQIKDIEFTKRAKIGKLEFKGVIDRLDFKDGLHLLIDYKSGSIANATKKDTEKLNDFQMNIYSKLLDMPSGINFAFLELFNDAKLTYLDGFEDKEEKLMEHIEYLENISSFSASRCENLQICRYCPYQLLCHRGEYL